MKLAEVIWIRWKAVAVVRKQIFWFLRLNVLIWYHVAWDSMAVVAKLYTVRLFGATLRSPPDLHCCTVERGKCFSVIPKAA
jgi:hypothetical protein